MLVLFVGWGSFYAYTLWRFHAEEASQGASTPARPAICRPSSKAASLVLEVVLLLSFAAPIWANRVDQFPTGPNVIHLRAVGEQFLWNFQYTGPDGKFGQRDLELVTAANPLGLDRNDPDAFDDLTTRNEMHLPVNQPVHRRRHVQGRHPRFLHPQHARRPRTPFPARSFRSGSSPIKERHLRNRLRPALRQRPFRHEATLVVESRGQVREVVQANYRPELSPAHRSHGGRRRSGPSGRRKSTASGPAKLGSSQPRAARPPPPASARAPARFDAPRKTARRPPGRS